MTEGSLATGPTSPDGGAHDEGDPTNMWGGEKMWIMVRSLGGPIRAGSEATGDAPSSVVEGPPVATEKTTPIVASVTLMGLRRPVQAQQRPRMSPPRVAATEVEEIV